ncbi:LutC/YkgG family protein [Spirosoma fluviale]|uniref:L-lactate dehydrogenase complex protein LldG n=1 Tax=Spirosoma fluviale TaxID=1597977 RepID=A0A286GAH5_9BACT|nr:LUD domain-containing protein [Spirosoma fluviale]SOD92256.1 L-lactate dehydrogenase complex protein LldG [Spirosoma fluviale]
MNSRENILADVLKNQPPARPLPDTDVFKDDSQHVVSTYCDVFTSIGGQVFLAKNWCEVSALIPRNFDATKRIITTLQELSESFELISTTADPHTFNDVELAVIEAELAVAENGAVWLPEQRMGQRIIPYICQHLAVVIPAHVIVATLHEAYAQIGEGNYGFGAFIGGPSKTADIEQALVLGAHGAITMTVFILEQSPDVPFAA